MDGKSRTMQKNNCKRCGCCSNSSRDGLCLACYELQLKCPAVLTQGNSKEQELNEAVETVKLQVNETVASANGTVGNVANKATKNSLSTNNKFINKHSKIIIKKQKNRCLVCQKKVGLFAVQCRCNGVYCAYHRYTDRHDCKFDYRALGAEEILRNNPRVVAAKIRKI